VTPRRSLAFLVVASLTAVSILAGAQTKKPVAPTAPAAAAPAKKAPSKPSGTAKPLTPDSDDGGPLAGRDERPPPTSSKDAGGGGAALESKTLDGGTRVFRFGEVEVEGRLKSPQIVYFLRRVRAEFAAGDLGHRTFMRELSETRNEPGY
jgi:hypothetical protein